MKKKFDYKKKKSSRNGIYSIMTGLVIVAFFLISAFLGAFGTDLGLLHYSPHESHLEKSNIPPSNQFLRSLLSEQLNSIEFENTIDDEYHILGTDVEGRDVFVCLLGGAATYTAAGVCALIICLTLGIIWGAITGYYRNSWYEKVNSFLIATIESFPILILMILIAFIFNFSFMSFVISLGIMYSIKVSNVIQTKIEVLKSSSFIEAARELGLSDKQIIFKHIIWYNCRHEVIVQIIYCFAGVILVEATLRYLNLGIAGAWITWGQMIYDGIGGKSAYQFYSGIYWQFLPPAVSICVLIIGLNLLGGGLLKYYGSQKASNL